MVKLISLFFLLILPNMAFAAFEWESHDEDRSIYYLGQIFGQVGTTLLGTGNILLADIFRIFNIVVLTLGTIVVVYSVIVSTISTAQEGEVMGKKFSSVWLPLRAAGGLALLLPTAGGYSLIQILMMWIIMQGIHGANKIWSLVLDRALTGQSLTQTVQVDTKNLLNSTKGLFQSLVCMHILNTHQGYQLLLNNDKITMHNNGREVWFGVDKAGSPYEAACGKMLIPDPPSQSQNLNSWIQAQRTGIEFAYHYMDSYAQEAVEHNNNRSEWRGQGVIAGGAKAMRGPISNAPIAVPVTTQFGNLIRMAREDGWIHAGSYYYKLIKPEGGLDYGAVSFQPPTFVQPDPSAYPGSWLIEVESISNAYIKNSDLATTTSPTSALIQRPSMLHGEVKQLADPVVKAFSSLARAFIGHLSDRDVDPIASFQRTGSEIMVTTESLFFGLILIAVVAMSIACIASAAQPGCYIVGIIITLFMPVLMIMMGLLWTAGVSLGLYLPLVPYLVFTFTALGWLLICIEAMVAAPIVALGITTPGQDLLGRASPAVMLITNIFLRPPLMVIGFVAAARLAKPVINMINFGFEGVVVMQMGVLLLFGNIALIVIYAGICVAAIHQVFSLIHILPDRVIRWIGGQAEQSMVEKAMEETRKASETAAHAGQQVMKGTTEGVVSAGKMAIEKSKGETPAGGGGGTQGGGKGGQGAQGVSGLQM